MASTYSPLLRLELIAAGEQAGLWGNTTNNNLSNLIEQAIAGVTNITLTSGSDYTLTQVNGTPDEARAAVLVVGGTPGGNVNINIPALQKTYIVKNTTSATLTFKCAAQTGGVAVVGGGATVLFCDGTGAFTAVDRLQISQGGTGGTTAATARAALGVPSLTGTDAAGTWNISVTGSANDVSAAGSTTTGEANKLTRLTNLGNLQIGTAGPAWKTTQRGVNVNFGALFGANTVNVSTSVPTTSGGVAFNAYLNEAGQWTYTGDGRGGALMYEQAIIDITVDSITNLEHRWLFSPISVTTAAGTTFVATGGMTLRRAHPNGVISLTVGGEVRATAYVTTSDRRLKTDLVRIPFALDKVCRLNGYTYRRTDWDGTQREIGLVAQEVQQEAPELVSADGEGILSVAYGNAVGLLVEAIKELRAEIELLKARSAT